MAAPQDPHLDFPFDLNEKVPQYFWKVIQVSIGINFLFLCNFLGNFAGGVLLSPGWWFGSNFQAARSSCLQLGEGMSKCISNSTGCSTNFFDHKNYGIAINGQQNPK
jgi:hypothetical protein